MVFLHLKNIYFTYDIGVKYVPQFYLILIFSSTEFSRIELFFYFEVTYMKTTEIFLIDSMSLYKYFFAKKDYFIHHQVKCNLGWLFIRMEISYFIRFTRMAMIN